MLKCVVFVLCAVSLTTIVFCAPSSENIREKQSRREDVTDQLIGATRTKRQNVEVVYLDASSLDATRIKGFQNKQPRPGPVNVGSNYGQNFQQTPQSNLELVSQNSEFEVYKLTTGDDNPLISLPGDRRIQNSNNHFYSYDGDQYSGYSGGRNPPPPDYGRPPPPPPHHHEGPPPPPPDFGRLTPHGGGPPDRFDRGPPHRPGGPPGRYDDRPPRHHGGPPDRFDDRPPHHHGGPPDRYDGRPPHHHGGPPDRHDDRPPHHHGGPPGGRPHPPRDGPDRFDMRPPYNRPPPPPHDHKPPHDREPDDDERDESNKNNDKPQKDDNSDKIDGTQTSSTTEAEIDDDNYELDVRFSNDEEKAPETMKRAVPSEGTSASLLSPSPFIYQAAAVRPED